MFGDISEADLIEICLVVLILPSVVLLLYEKVRSQFPIKVNCWFCNSYLYVPYNDRDSFTCTSCKQYNGFNSDGSYNRPIPEQYDDMLNPQPTFNKKRQDNNQIKLCKICNNNQQLKIYQLANFIPLIDDNFDMEIEHFQKQLEKAYKLCQKCDKMVNKTIKQQTKRLIGQKMLYYRKKGLDSSILENSKRKYILAFFKTLSLIFLILILSNFLLLKDPYGVNIFLQEYSTKHGLTYSTVATCFFTTGLAALFGSWLYIYKMLTKIKINKNQIKTEEESPKNVSSKLKKGKLTNLQLNSTDISTDSIESDYEDFSETIKSRHNTLLPQNTIPIFGEKAILRNSLNQSKSPISFKELNQTNLKSNQDLSRSFVSLDTSFSSARSVNLNEFNINTGQFSQIRKPTVFKAQDLDVTFSNLNLNSGVRTKSILSPTKFNNPWSGLNTKLDVPSRSSSQSSGIFTSENCNSLPNSRATSINGDFDNCSVLADTTFVYAKNTPNYFQLRSSFSNKNNLSYLSHIGGVSSAFSRPSNHFMNYADMHPFNTSFNTSNFD